MKVDNKEALDGILDILKNDETLSAYVTNISHGDMGCARKRFPFINVGIFRIRPERMNAGSIYLLYTVEIAAGTSNLVPGVAYKGSDTGKKGINDLCDDICNAIRGKRIAHPFEPIFQMTSDPNYRRDKGETIHIGLVTFTVHAWFRYSDS